ncbi:MAG: hypothetical protein IJT72_10130 [Lachnospiraceae bacterium]|nr:hypothetical protein [Lachnospiraceae bacterium]
MMTYVEDIYVIYKEKINSEQVHNIVLLTKNGKLKINALGLDENGKDKFMQTIKSFCPNAVIGKTSQNMKYYKECKRKNNGGR